MAGAVAGVALTLGWFWVRAEAPRIPKIPDIGASRPRGGDSRTGADPYDAVTRQLAEAWKRVEARQRDLQEFGWDL